MIAARHALLRILVVDDKDQTREAIRRRIERRSDHYRIVTAETGQEALAQLADSAFDVVLCDLKLRRSGSLDGIEVTRRALAHYPEIRVVIFTGTDAERKLEALAAGAFSYLSKPIDYDELLHTIQTIDAIRRTEKLEQSFRTLARIAADLQTSLDSDALADRIVHGACNLGFNRARLYLLDSVHNTLVGQAACGLPMRVAFKGYRIPLTAMPIISKIFAQDGPTILDRAVVADEFPGVTMEPWLSDLELHETPSIDCPLRVKDQNIGSLAVDNLGAADIAYSRDDLEILGVLASLSAQALANSRAYEQEARANASLRWVLEDAPDAVITTDRHGMITFASSSTERVTGHPSSEMVGRLAAEFYTDASGSPEVGRQLAEEIMQEARSKGAVSNRPVHLVGHGGPPRSLTISVGLLRDRADGRDIGTLGFLKQQTQLEVQGRKYRDLLEGFGYGSMQLSVDGKVDYLNPKAARLLARRRQSVEGEHFAALVLAPQRRRLERTLEAVLAGREEDEVDLSIVRPDGSRLPVKVRLTLLSRGEQATGVAVALFDKSELQALIRSGRLMALGQMATGVAHEINNPVNNLTANLADLEEALTARDAWGPEERESCRAMRRSALRIRDIVQRMTRFSHSSAFEPEPLILAEIMNDVTSFFRTSLRHRNIELQLQINPALPPVAGERSRLQQLFVALLTNASEALEEQDGERQICIAALAETADCLTIRVCDNGPGIPDTEREAIFDPFFTTKKNGTGLGLFIVQRIVEEHGGSIQVEDGESGHGTCFKIELPRADGGASAARNAAAECEV